MNENLDFDYLSMAKEYGLNIRQELFCIYYFRYKEATMAYKLAYGCSDKVANSNAYKMMKNEKVRAYYHRFECMIYLNLAIRIDKTETKGLIEKLEALIQYLDANYADNPYHWNKPIQPF